MRSSLLVWVAVVGLGCGSGSGSGKGTPPIPDAAPRPLPAAVAPATQPASAPAPVAPPPLKARPGGPSLEACGTAADHLADLVTQGIAPSGLSDEQMAYSTAMLHQERDGVVRFCLETAAPKEIDCVIAAQTAAALAGCERFRREIPADMLDHMQVTQKDCERFFDRLRQFKIADGADPAEVDKTRDQIVRACEEKAKPGTITCFLASPDYAHARMCP